MGSVYPRGTPWQGSWACPPTLGLSLPAQSLQRLGRGARRGLRAACRSLGVGISTLGVGISTLVAMKNSHWIWDFSKESSRNLLVFIFNNRFFEM